MFSDIRLQHFRSYVDDSFELSAGVNIIVGPNASGKTNLLEAIIVAALGSSYRAKDQELVAFDQPWARIDAHDDHTRVIKLVVQPNQSVKKEFVIDDQSLQRLQLNRTVPTVLFEPNHLSLLSGSPDLRRDYLDNLLEQLVTGYSTLRRNYRRALAQRNALLKNGSPTPDQLFVWNLRLSELGGQVALHRQRLVEKFQAQIGEIYQNLSRTDSTVEVRYDSTCGGEQYSSQLLRQLEARQSKDLQRGFTSVGPHRDDMVVMLNNHLATVSASRGEMRTLLLAFKVLELQLLEDTRNQKPILLLDDVFSELDGARRKALTQVIKGYQTFITTTDADVVVQHFMDECNIIPTSK